MEQAHKTIELELPIINFSSAVIYDSLLKYVKKDEYKANEANKFIGRGAPGSSTDRYNRILKKYNIPVNNGTYTKQDVVFVSVNGKRPGALPLDKVEVMKAIQAGATLITDGPINRPEAGRGYNIGEEALANLLKQNGYKEHVERNGAVSRWAKDGEQPMKIKRIPISTPVQEMNQGLSNDENKNQVKSPTANRVTKIQAHNNYCVIKHVDPFLPNKLKDNYVTYEAWSYEQLKIYNKKANPAAQKTPVLLGTEMECKLYAICDKETRQVIVDRIETRKNLFNPLPSAKQADIDQLHNKYSHLTEKLNDSMRVYSAAISVALKAKQSISK